MSYHFDNNNRYQIIFPYTSDKIHVEKDLNHGAYKCYQELKELDVKTYLFMVHDMDNGVIYHFNIPKYKAYEHQTEPKPKEVDKSYILTTVENDKSQLQNIQTAQTVQTVQPFQTIQTAQAVQLDQSRLNDLIVRLNNVEYQLDKIKKSVTKHPKKDEGCVII